MSHSFNIQDFQDVSYGAASFLYEAGRRDEDGCLEVREGFYLVAETPCGIRFQTEAQFLCEDKEWYFSGHRYGCEHWDQEDEIGLMDDEERQRRGF
jgi:hypothetical protein